MEEKKLTDEEVVNALDFCINNVCSLGCPMRSDTSCVQTLRIQSLALIHRLQDENETQRKIIEYQDGLPDLVEQQKAEIERLTEEKTESAKTAVEVLEQNIELQKQVDELKEENTELYKEHTALIAGSILQKQNIAKDTAKEIITMIDGTCASMKTYLCSIIAKRYGVEVE